MKYKFLSIDEICGEIWALIICGFKNDKMSFQIHHIKNLQKKKKNPS